MTQNIEERTQVAVTRYEGAAKSVDEIAHKDADVVTPVGSRKSFPKISREWDEKATELKTIWENDSATLRQDWQNERNELSTKALGVKPWESGVSETNINQQRRWDDGHTYLPKTLPAVMDDSGPNDDWIPYTANKSDTLNDVFGRKPIDLTEGIILSPDLQHNYPKLNAFGSLWELKDGDAQYNVTSFARSGDNYIIITMSSGAQVVANKVLGASKNWVNEQVNRSEQKLSQSVADQNGSDWFIDRAFSVVNNAGVLQISPGVGYISGFRIENTEISSLGASIFPCFIYVDVWREEQGTGNFVTQYTVYSSTEEITDYMDGNSLHHSVCKLADITSDKSVIDTRPLPALERRSRLTVKASDMATYPSEQSIYDALEKAVRVNAARVIIDDLICPLSQKKEFRGLRNCRVTFTGCEITVEDLDERLIFIEPVNCTFESDCSEIKGRVVSTQYAKDNPITGVLPVIKLVKPYFCRTRNFFGSNIRSIVEHENAKFCTAKGSHVSGGLTDDATLSSGLSYGANFMSAVVFSGGAHNVAYGNSAENHGSAVLAGMDTKSFVAFSNVGENLHDNGVYLSSSKGSIGFANAFQKISGSGVKARGGNNICVLNAVDDANVAVDMTGNGITADEKGSNGASNLLALNSASKSRAHDYRLTTQDGLKTRDSIMALNASNQHLGVGEYTPMKISSKEGALVIGNLIGESEADFALMATGSAEDGNEIVVALNLFGGGKRFSCRLNDTDKYIYGLNLHKGGLKGLEARQLDVGTIIGNVADLDQPVATISNTYNSTSAILSGNVGLILGNVMPGKILTEANFNGDLPWPSNYEPVRPLQLREHNGELFISISLGNDLYEFKKVMLVDV